MQLYFMYTSFNYFSNCNNFYNLQPYHILPIGAQQQRLLVLRSGDLGSSPLCGDGNDAAKEKKDFSIPPFPQKKYLSYFCF